MPATREGVVETISAALVQTLGTTTKETVIALPRLNSDDIETIANPDTGGLTNEAVAMLDEKVREASQGLLRVVGQFHKLVQAPVFALMRWSRDGVETIFEFVIDPNPVVGYPYLEALINRIQRQNPFDMCM